jgi:hypothetical protein
MRRALPINKRDERQLGINNQIKICLPPYAKIIVKNSDVQQFADCSIKLR